MYNSASQEFDSTYPVNIVVRNDGVCNHVPPGIFKSTCKVYSNIMQLSCTYNGLTQEIRMNLRNVSFHSD